MALSTNRKNRVLRVPATTDPGKAKSAGSPASERRSGCLLPAANRNDRQPTRELMAKDDALATSTETIVYDILKPRNEYKVAINDACPVGCRYSTLRSCG
jgi:hypothetical protein